MNNQEIINEYNSGKSGVRIATQLNVSYGKIYRILRLNNVKFRPRGASKGFHNFKNAKVKLTEIPKIIERYKTTTDTLQIIAKDYNVTKQAIDQLLRKYKVTKRKTDRVRLFRKKEDIDEVINMYNNNLSVCKIAKKFSCSLHTIIRVLRSNRINIRSYKKINKSEHAKIVKRYKHGEFMKDIAKDYNASTSTLTNILKKHKIKTRKLKKLTPALYKAIGKYIKKNYSYEQISCKLGIKVPTVGFVARKVKYENQ